MAYKRQWMACAPSLVLSWLCRLMDNHSHVLVDLTHSPTINCSSATSCDITCNTAYSACTGSNTYGCCGSSCIFYNIAVKCKCICSSTYSRTPHLVGTANVDLCTTSSCKLACSSTYPSVCNIYKNQAYFSYAMGQYRVISMITIVFSFVTLYFGSQCFFI